MHLSSSLPSAQLESTHLASRTASSHQLPSPQVTLLGVSATEENSSRRHSRPSLHPSSPSHLLPEELADTSDSDNLPLSSESDFDFILTVLLEHALRHSLHELIVELWDLRPGLFGEGNSPHMNPGQRLMLLLRCGMAAVLGHGPLPEILTPAFNTTFQDILLHLMERWPNLVVHHMTRIDLAQAICGLRFITLLDVLHDPARYTRQYVVGAVEAYFPGPDSPGWTPTWQRFTAAFHLDTATKQEQASFRNIMAAGLKTGERYFSKRLRIEAEAQREKDRTQSALNVWSEISPIFWKLLDNLEAVLGPSRLDLLTEKEGECLLPLSSPWRRFFLSRLAEDKSEARLIDLLAELKDLSVENEF